MDTFAAALAHQAGAATMNGTGARSGQRAAANDIQPQRGGQRAEPASCQDRINALIAEKIAAASSTVPTPTPLVRLTGSDR